MATIIVLALVAAAAGFALRHIWKHRGQPSCGGNCGCCGCSGCAHRK